MDTDDSILKELMIYHKLPYIDDAGFSERVVAALPQRRRTFGKSRRTVLLITSCFLSMILALLLAGPSLVADLFSSMEIALDRPEVVLAGVNMSLLPLIFFFSGLGLACAMNYRVLRFDWHS